MCIHYLFITAYSWTSFTANLYPYFQIKNGNNDYSTIKKRNKNEANGSDSSDIDHLQSVKNLSIAEELYNAQVAMLMHIVYRFFVYRYQRKIVIQ